MGKKILLVGESWTSFTTHIKGFDTFVTSAYEEGKEYIEKALIKAGYDIDYLPNHLASEKFPYTVEELGEYACVILSDIGSNTLLLPPDTFIKGVVHKNRIRTIVEYVENGGALLMIGGYMSFSGIDAKARYGVTELAKVLPVTCLQIDDREENAQGIVAVVQKEHEALKEVSKEWPILLGYNKTVARMDCETPITIGGDPLIAFGTFGKGKSAVFTSDCAPHWGCEQFIQWESYDILWKGIVDYITN